MTNDNQMVTQIQILQQYYQTNPTDEHLEALLAWMKKYQSNHPVSTKNDNKSNLSQPLNPSLAMRLGDFLNRPSDELLKAYLTALIKESNR